MTTDAVLYEVADHVATITFNRPDQQNTISGPMLNSLTEMLLQADADTDIRAIIVTGAGKFFCAGLDLRGSDITNNLSEGKSSPANLDLRNTPPTVLHNLDTPTIAAMSRRYRNGTWVTEYRVSFPRASKEATIPQVPRQQ